MTDSKTKTEQFAQLVEDYGDECDLRGASSTRACGMFGLICDKYEQAIAATLGKQTWRNSYDQKRYDRWYNSLFHGEPSSFKELIEDVIWTTEIVELGPNGNECQGVDEGEVYTDSLIRTWAEKAATLGWIDEPDTIRNELADGGMVTPERTVAATLGSDPSIEWGRIITGLIAAHYDNDEERFKECAVQAAKMYDKAGKCDVAEYIIAQYCPAAAFVPM